MRARLPACIAAIFLLLSFAWSGRLQAQQANASKYRLFWPPVANQLYPDLALYSSSGKLVKLSSYAGKIILVEPVGMSCPACQAFAGGNERGGFCNVRPQADLRSLDSLLSEQGISPADPRLMRIQLLLYSPSMQAPTLKEAQEWARHFQTGRQANEFVLVGDSRFINQHSYNMIPGFQLIDANFVLRSDSTGHNPRDNLYSHLLPMLKTMLR